MPSRTGLRCRLAIRSRIAADELRSMDSAHRTHLAAKWSHVALLSVERVNSAIARHSAANLLNFSVEFIEPSSLCRILSYPTCAFISAGGSLHPLEWQSRDAADSVPRSAPALCAPPRGWAFARDGPSNQDFPYDEARTVDPHIDRPRRCLRGTDQPADRKRCGGNQ